MTSTRDTKNPGGRPATGKGTPVMVRLQPMDLAALDAHRGDQTRPEAIRAILKEKHAQMRADIEAMPEGPAKSAAKKIAAQVRSIDALQRQHTALSAKPKA